MDFASVKGSIAIGNTAGLELISGVHLLKQTIELQNTEITALETIIASLQRDKEGQKSNILSLEGQIVGLRHWVEAYKDVRGRFISTFVQRKLREITQQDAHVIEMGNAEEAHGGDIKIDAALYDGPNRRRDHHHFKTLYGCAPQVVSSLSK